MFEPLTTTERTALLERLDSASLHLIEVRNANGTRDGVFYDITMELWHLYKDVRDSGTHYVSLLPVR